MFTHILVPLDGSERAERAVPVAAQIARSSGGRLTLMQAITFPTPGVWPFGGPELPLPAINRDQWQAADYLKSVTKWPILSGLRADTTIVVGSAAATILDTAREEQVDLIVICSHGRTGATRWALGSVAEHIARHASAPVLVLRATGAIPEAPPTDLHRPLRVLVPLDGSHIAEGAIVPAAGLITALAAPARGALHLILVLAPFETDRANMPDALALDGARAYLQRMAVRLQVAYPDLALSWSVASDLDVAAALLRAAETGEAVEKEMTRRAMPSDSDLIAMATHGYSGITHLTLGSITERVLHGTKLPLLIVRPAEATRKWQHTEQQAAGAKPIERPWTALF